MALHRRVIIRDVLGALVALTCVQSWALAAKVTFDQVDWLDNHGGYTSKMSEWGDATVEFSSRDAGMFYRSGSGYYGYVNIVASVPGGHLNNWAIENYPVYFDDPAELDEALPSSLSFDLGTVRGSQRVNILSYYMTVDPAPRASAPLGTMVGSPVGVSRWLFGGVRNPRHSPPYSGNSGQAPPPPARNFGFFRPNEKPKPADGAAVKNPRSNIRPVDEDKSGCSPAAAARSIEYLVLTGELAPFGLTVQQIYDELKDDMGTWTWSPFAGTDPDSFIPGKEKFAKRHKLPLTNLKLNNVELVKDLLKNGADVEVGFYRGKNAQGKDLGGHTAFVEKIIPLETQGKITGYILRFVDDGEQGDGKASNRTVQLVIDPDGTIRNEGVGAQVTEFFVEFVVPEPSTLFLLAAGFIAMVAVRRP